MLILKRHVNDRVFIGDGICVQVTEIGQGWVRLGFTAPQDVAIHREEVRDRIALEAEAAKRAAGRG